MSRCMFRLVAMVFLVALAIGPLELDVASAATKNPAVPLTASPNPRAGQTIAVLDAINANSGAGYGPNALQTSYATDAIVLALEKQGMVATRWSESAGASDGGGAPLCDKTKTDIIIEPVLFSRETDGNDGPGTWDTVSIQLKTFDCATHAIVLVAGPTNSAFNWKLAADRSIVAVVKRYLGIKAGSN